MALEEAKYTVIMKEGSYELRRYEPHIVAETVVDGDFDKAGNEGFRRLFKYISGENQKKQSLAMTAPVAQDAGPEKIAMTAPVSQERTGDRWRIAFVMPAEYTLDTLPQPVDPAVLLRQTPARRMAAVTYSGSWSKTRYEEQKALLEAFMQRQRLSPLGEPVLARYNSPFTLWFLRRNEVLIPVQGPDDERK
ncbi:MAG: heme-binding protein [Nitrospirae bacterium]|nr:heme-binding protein [Nitrospirota bacterium]NTW65023.1 heme-binding protein [Nitrospirota bacterium]